MASTNWVEDVLTFWFDELGEDGWWESKVETDATITERFASLHADLAAKIPDETAQDARTALAAVIVLDQFSRNMFRGKPEAFASDPLALETAATAVRNGLDAQLHADGRQFLYMPFMHSERLDDQDRCVELFQTHRPDVAEHAVEHRDIVARFGRFPHRNRILGRESTPEEQAFLEGHSGFGQ